MILDLGAAYVLPVVSLRTFEGGIRWFCRHVIAKVETVLFAADPAWTQQLQDVIAVCEQWLAAV